MPIRKNSMTEEKIKKKFANGDGQGEGANYRPFIRVGDFASSGRVHRILSSNGRIQHFFSDLEKDYYYYLLWNDQVIDIKEQYPLDREATIRIAATLGIKHPADPKTGVPIVMTTDFVITALSNGKKQTFARSIKYQSDLEKRRVCEKQTIEKTYWAEKDIGWNIITEHSFSRDRSHNIQFLMNYYQDETVDGLPNELLRILVDRLMNANNKKLARVCREIEEDLSIPNGKVLAAVYYYAAHKVLPLHLDARWNAWTVNEIIDIQKLRLYWEEGLYEQNAAIGG